MIGSIGFFRDKRKENPSYYLGLRGQSLGLIKQVLMLKRNHNHNGGGFRLLIIGM